MKDAPLPRRVWFQELRAAGRIPDATIVGAQILDFSLFLLFDSWC